MQTNTKGHIMQRANRLPEKENRFVGVGVYGLRSELFLCDYLPAQRTHRVKFNLESLNSRRLNNLSSFGVMNIGGTIRYVPCNAI